jgi:DeoR family fructose operon transcriptional repressor
MAADLIKPRDTIYLDAGPTVAAIARKIADRKVSPLRIVSCSLPATEILASVVGVEVFLTAGQILTRQSALFGDFAVRSLKHWHFDHSFISCEGLDADGLWNTSPGIVALQQTVHKRSQFLHVCIDSTKVGRKAAVKLFDWTEKFDILSDELLENLKGFGYRSPTR